MSRRFTVNAPAVLSEVIDGEAVMMNLQSGHYYSAQGTGALVWQWLEHGCSDGEAAAALAARYGLGGAEASRAVGHFVAELECHELVTESAARVPRVPADAGPGDAPAAWAAPVLSVFTDVEDVLLLDPIHAAGEAGWPTPEPGAGRPA